MRCAWCWPDPWEPLLRRRGCGCGAEAKRRPRRPDVRRSEPATGAFRGGDPGGINDAKVRRGRLSAADTAALMPPTRRIRWASAGRSSVIHRHNPPIRATKRTRAQSLGAVVDRHDHPAPTHGCARLPRALPGHHYADPMSHTSHLRCDSEELTRTRPSENVPPRRPRPGQPRSGQPHRPPATASEDPPREGVADLRHRGNLRCYVNHAGSEIEGKRFNAAPKSC